MAGSSSSDDLTRSSNSFRLLEKQLGKKVDQPLFDREVQHLREIANEAKSIALGAKKRAEVPHSCVMHDQFQEIHGNLRSMRALKVGTMVTVFLLIVGAVAQYYGFKNAVDNNSAALIEVKKTLEKFSDSQQETERRFTKVETKMGYSDNVINQLGDFLDSQKEEKPTKRKR